MGIKDFSKIVIYAPGKPHHKRTLGDLGHPITFKEMRGKLVCFDAYNILYRAMSAFGNRITDRGGNTVAHIINVFNIVMQFEEAEQLWIFDNPVVDPLKQATVDARAEQKAKRGGYTLNPQHIEDMKSLLTLLGVTYTVAPTTKEAEQLGASLCLAEYCDFIWSMDADILLFGGNWLRPVKTGRKTSYLLYNLKDVLNSIEMSREELISTCIAISGCDFCDSTKGIGPSTGMRRFKHNEIELSPDQIVARDKFLEEFTDKDPDPETVDGQYDKDSLLDYLASKGLSRATYTKKLITYRV